MFNSIKNNLLLVIFLCAIVVPVGVWGAVDVVGDKDGYLNSNSNGSYFSFETTTGVGELIKISTAIPVLQGATIPLALNGTGKEKNWTTLYSGNLNNAKLTPLEFDALKTKLKADGSPVADKITINNVSRQNTDNVSTFVYDPTMDNSKNGDSVNIGYATKVDGKTGGEFYTAMKPALTESEQANKELNIIDVAQGRPSGTTIAEKAELYNSEIQKKLDQQKVTEQVLKEEAAKARLEEARKSGNVEDIKTAEAELDSLMKKGDSVQSQYNNSLQKYTENQARADASGKADASVGEYKCSIGSPLNCVLWTAAILANIVFKITSFVAYIAGTLFDYSLEFSINSAEFFKKLGVIEITWSFIRDVLNMTFIFILLWTAIQILISNDAKYSAKKILINVIVVAILMNFSLFAAKLMVDGSNVVSLKIYEAMKANTKDSSGKIIKGASISERVMNTVGLSALYNVSEIFKSNTIQAEGTCANNPVSLIIVSVMGSVFLIVLILALGLAAILFLIRVVNIIYLFIKSPLWVWGYVIPGNATMEKLKNDWQSQMRHVLLFPITYLFWMLIAVIVFEKLGTVTKVDGAGKGKSLLDLICNPPGSAGIGGSISLVAIFIIVIILMMKAIEYGVKHANDGGSGAAGGGINNWATKKFSGYQTAMTTGLAKKAGTFTTTVAAGASVGATKVPLRAVSGGIGAYKSMKNKEGFWKGANDGFSNPGINLKEMTSGVLGKAAMITGSQTLARKAVVLADESTKARKVKDEKITKGSKETEENLQKIAAKEYKIDTQEQWEKKNGKIGSDTAKADEYKNYVTKQIEKRADASLSKGVIKQNNKDGIKHLDSLKAKAISTDTDAAGNIKIKINNRDIATGLNDVLKYHTTGAGKDSQAITKKGWYKPFRTKKAEARIKAAEASFRAEESKYSGDQAEKDLETMIKKTEEKLQRMPDDDTLDKIEGQSGTTLKNIITGDAAKHPKEIRELNKAVIKYNLNVGTGASTIVIADLQEKVQDAVEKIKVARNKDIRELIKHKENLKRKEEKRAKENQ
jgi:hypothetical protein